MMTHLLGQLAGAADTLISGKWLLDAIPVVAGAAVILLGKNHWKNQGAKESQSSDVTLKKPVPTIATREKPVAATKADLDASIRDGTVRHNDCRKYQSEQHTNIHRRLDDQVQALARMEGTLAAVQQTTNTLLDIALQKKPNSRS